MLLVHLIHQGMSLGWHADLWVGEYTRFAAGGFIFIAGLSVGRIYLPRAIDPQLRGAAYYALFRRAGLIIAVHWVAEISFLIMWPLFGGITFREPARRVGEVFLLQSGYDLLPFYVVMVALSPLLLEMLRRRLHWLVAAMSVAVFLVSHATGWWHSHTLPIQRDFYPSLWQVIFVAGLLSADLLTGYDRLSRRGKAAVVCVAWALHGLMFVAYYGPDFGLYLYLPLSFTKVPLSEGEALRYLTLIVAIATTTDLLWKPLLSGRAFTEAAECLGRNSLWVYVAHVWIVQIAVRGSDFVPHAWGRLLIALAALLVMWTFARWVDRAGRSRPGDRRRRRWFDRTVPPVVSTGVCSLVLLLLVNAQQSARGLRSFEGDDTVPSAAENLLMDHDDPPPDVEDDIEGLLNSSVFEIQWSSRVREALRA